MTPPDATEAHEPSHGPVVVKAWAPSCGSCRAIETRVDAVATATGVEVVDLRVDLDPDLVEALGVRSVPTLIGLRDGTEVGRLVGLQPADAIDALFTTTRSGVGNVAGRTPTSLVAARGAAGGALVVASVALGVGVLAVVGTALLSWALAGLVLRRG